MTVKELVKHSEHKQIDIYIGFRIEEKYTPDSKYNDSEVYRWEVTYNEDYAHSGDPFTLEIRIK